MNPLSTRPIGLNACVPTQVNETCLVIDPYYAGTIGRVLLSNATNGRPRYFTVTVQDKARTVKRSVFVWRSSDPDTKHWVIDYADKDNAGVYVQAGSTAGLHPALHAALVKASELGRERGYW